MNKVIDKKKIVALSVALFGIMLLAVGLSYSFLTFEEVGLKTNKISAGTLELSFSDTNEIKMIDAVPQSNAMGLKNNPEYTFTLSNTGTIASNYEIYLKDVCNTSNTYEIDSVQVQPDYCVPIDYINAGIKIGSEEYVVKVEADGKIVLDSGVINASTSLDLMKVKIWLNEDTPNTYNKEGDIVLVALKLEIMGTQLSVLEDDDEPEDASCFESKVIDDFDLISHPGMGFEDLGKIIITDYLCYSGNPEGLPVITELTIPNKINNKDVVAIASTDNVSRKSFYAKNLTSVTFPSTLKVIGTRSFDNNNLTGTLTIPSSVVRIYNSAFASTTINTNKINSIVFEANSSLYLIGENAFYSNKLKGTLTIPKSVQMIGNSAFAARSADTATNQIDALLFEPGSTLEIIDLFAFAYNNLKTLTIPKSVKTIGSNAFSGGGGISQTTTNNKITSLTFESGSVLQTINNNAFFGCNLASITVPSSVTSIGVGAFHKATGYSNPNLTTISNKTGRSFAWADTLNLSTGGASFVTGTAISASGNVTVTN